MNEISILFILSFVIFASPYIATFLRIPILPTEIILGIAFKNLGLLGESELFKIVADIGFYYLMFLAGMGVDLKLFFKTQKSVLKTAFLYIASLYLLAIFSVYALGLSKIFVVVIPLMSVGILATLYKEYGKNQAWLNLAMSVGVIGELVSIGCLTLLSEYLKFGLSKELFINLAILVGFLLAFALFVKGLEVLFWWYPNLRKTLMPHFDKSEKDVRLSMAIFTFTIAIMMLLDLKIVLGAFIAGTILPTFFGHKKALPNKLSSFGFGLLVPIFFVYIGSTIDIKALFSYEILAITLLIVFLIVFTRTFMATLILRNFGRKSLLFGLSISMPFTLLIATATMGLKANFITQNLYYAMIFASILEVILCVILIKFIFDLKKNIK